jgi:hypothetical protein
MTKVHEQLVIGPIAAILSARFDERGEFTVVANIGLTTDLMNISVPAAPSGKILLGEITEIRGSSRRAAVAALSRKYQLPPNEVYEAIERAKKSGL